MTGIATVGLVVTIDDQGRTGGVSETQGINLMNTICVMISMRPGEKHQSETLACDDSKVARFQVETEARMLPEKYLMRRPSPWRRMPCLTTPATGCPLT